MDDTLLLCYCFIEEVNVDNVKNNNNKPYGRRKNVVSFRIAQTFHTMSKLPSMLASPFCYCVIVIGVLLLCYCFIEDVNVDDDEKNNKELFRKGPLQKKVSI